jgi:hypothetical protein
MKAIQFREASVNTSLSTPCRNLETLFFSSHLLRLEFQSPIPVAVRFKAWVCGRLLRLRVQITPVAWMSVCYECCVLSGRGLCFGLITRPEESYRVWCVSGCDGVASVLRISWPTMGCCAVGGTRRIKSREF